MTHLPGHRATPGSARRPRPRLGATWCWSPATGQGGPLRRRRPRSSCSPTSPQAAEDYRRGHDRLTCWSTTPAATGRPATTADGLEWTFAVNHLAYFLLTNLLLDLLQASAPARIVNVTSSAQAFGDIHLDDLQFERRYRGQAAYNQSKLANVLFTYELAHRLDGTGVTVNCLAPGVARTNFGRDDSGPVMRLLTPVARPFMRSPEEGAATAVWLASSPQAEGVTAATTCAAGQGPPPGGPPGAPTTPSWPGGCGRSARN